MPQLFKIFKFIKSYFFLLIKNPFIPSYKKKRFLKNHTSKATDLNLTYENISIIIPCYGHARYLIEAINSALDQSIKPYEVIIINDNSPDDSDSLIDEFLTNNYFDIPINYIKNEQNMGQCASINKAIESSTNQLFMILNDDDILFDDAIMKASEMMSKNLDIQLLGFTCVIGENDAQINNEIINRTTLPISSLDSKKILPLQSRKVNLITEINMLHTSQTFTRHAWETSGKYIPNKKERIVYAGDRDFQLRVAYLYPIMILNHPVAIWRNYTSVDKSKYS